MHPCWERSSNSCDRFVPATASFEKKEEEKNNVINKSMIFYISKKNIRNLEFYVIAYFKSF